jgi:hypothetical protein
MWIGCELRAKFFFFKITAYTPRSRILIRLYRYVLGASARFASRVVHSIFSYISRIIHLVRHYALSVLWELRYLYSLQCPKFKAEKTLLMLICSSIPAPSSYGYYDCSSRRLATQHPRLYPPPPPSDPIRKVSFVHSTNSRRDTYSCHHPPKGTKQPFPPLLSHPPPASHPPHQAAPPLVR